MFGCIHDLIDFVPVVIRVDILVHLIVPVFHSWKPTNQPTKTKKCVRLGIEWQSRLYEWCSGYECSCRSRCLACQPNRSFDGSVTTKLWETNIGITRIIEQGNEYHCLPRTRWTVIGNGITFVQFLSIESDGSIDILCVSWIEYCDWSSGWGQGKEEASNYVVFGLINNTKCGGKRRRIWRLPELERSWQEREKLQAGENAAVANSDAVARQQREVKQNDHTIHYIEMQLNE